MSNHITSVDQLKRAIIIAEQIESLQAELDQILSGKVSTPATSKASKDPRRDQRSAAVRAKMAAAQKARWAAKRASGTTPEVIGHIALIESAAPVSTVPLKAGPGTSIPLSELKPLLEAAPEKTLNIRKAGLQLRNIKVLATANPHLLRLGGKNPWPTVTMLK
jgi:hypothetical protein